MRQMSVGRKASELDEVQWRTKLRKQEKEGREQCSANQTARREQHTSAAAASVIVGIQRTACDCPKAVLSEPAKPSDDDASGKNETNKEEKAGREAGSERKLKERLVKREGYIDENCCSVLELRCSERNEHEHHGTEAPRLHGRRRVANHPEGARIHCIALAREPCDGTPSTAVSTVKRLMSGPSEAPADTARIDLSTNNRGSSMQAHELQPSPRTWIFF